MDLITLDWETYYDKDYSLSKMSMEDYVTDDRFEIMMVGVKVNEDAARWYSYEKIEDYAKLFEALGLRDSAMLAHNTLFDALILTHHFSILPSMLLDTLSIAQAVQKPYQRSISLDSCLKKLDAPIRKLGYLANMMGRRRNTLSTQEMERFGEYCVTDVEGAYWLFKSLAPLIPRSELEVIDLTLRMYLQPQFLLDTNILQGVLDDTRKRKQALIAKLPSHVKKSQLSSNVQFAHLLESLGVDVPLKVSPTTNKPTFAFAKNDEGWKELEDQWQDDPIVGPILAARLGVKSTIAETRAERLLNIGEKYGKLRVPLRYYAAHTGRYGGMEKINCQNLTRINPKNPSRNQLRYAVSAPKDHAVLACDLSQIEARLNAWLSGCTELLHVFSTGGDPYCAFASKAYGREITKEDQHERFIGKTCILGLGYGMGAKKLRATLRAQGVKEDMSSVERYVSVYRDTYPQIPALWYYCDETIKIMAAKGERAIGPCRAKGKKIWLPNGMSLAYPNLRWVENSKYRGWSYDFAKQGRTMWGGKMVENLVQSLARITIVEHMLEAKHRHGLKPALQAHDELVYVVPMKHLEEYSYALLDIMKTPPSFAPDLPIGAEAAAGLTYGDAK
jgi:DNA polymerase